MPLPFVTRDHYEDMKAQLETQLAKLQKDYDRLQKQADSLAEAVINSEKHEEEPSTPADDPHFKRKISDVREWANLRMRRKFEEKERTA